MSDKLVYYFGEGPADTDLKPLLGGKGANLGEMTRIGLPVPPGFTITTEVCTHFSAHHGAYPGTLRAEVAAALARLEDSQGKQLGGTDHPLLLSVRSGARDSMPGMMDTILNLGMNDATVDIVARQSGHPRFAWDSYRRFLQMYGDVVMGVQKRPGEAHDPFEQAIESVKLDHHQDKHLPDNELTHPDLVELVARFKALIRERTGHDFPQDPHEQLWGAIGAVFRSWNNDRAIVYRRKYDIPHSWGTAVNVQTMVFGNRGDTSATGVAFTRNPATGEKTFYGEYLINAQGEDVVAGVRTPQPIRQLGDDMPGVYQQLLQVRDLLESHFRDMQDIEFTIEEGRLYMLQTRHGKRTGRAAVKIAVDMVREGLISQADALARVPADSLAHLLAPVFDQSALTRATQIATGLPAGPGAASGLLVLTAEEAVEWAHQGKQVILARIETSPEDLRGMIAAQGILTIRGGVSSHAALVARQMGKVCVCGAGGLHIDYEKQTLTAPGLTIRQGEPISIDGTTGTVFSGSVQTAPSEVVQVVVHRTLDPAASETYQDYAALLDWAQQTRRLGLRANADTPDQVRTALAFGAQGVGLCRTEHMFFDAERIDVMRQMILAHDPAGRRHALDRLLPFQQTDFEEIFRALHGLPATIRLLDPPLHEFLPHDPEQIAALAQRLHVSPDDITHRVDQLLEFNPMLGHRGCRLGIVYPEISEMQVRAIFRAAAQVLGEGIPAAPEIMIPLVGFPKELQLQTDIIHRIAREVGEEKSLTFQYTVGVMIEIPRAALVADELAETAEFFSFGTNDLTQTALGMSRDDSASFMPTYTELEITPGNPFATVDQTGVGRLMEIARDRARETRPGIKMGVCGEHGGDPRSIAYFHTLGLDYVSCSPFRLPIASLAAAQAALRDK